MIRNAIRRFMYGRYGNDQLNLFLMGLYLLLYLVFMFTRLDLLYIASFALLACTLFRLLSRNMAPSSAGCACAAPSAGIRSMSISNAPAAANSSASPGGGAKSPSPAAAAALASRKSVDHLRPAVKAGRCLFPGGMV